jgi:hypothetical protein
VTPLEFVSFLLSSSVINDVEPTNVLLKTKQNKTKKQVLNSVESTLVKKYTHHATHTHFIHTHTHTHT